MIIYKKDILRRFFFFHLYGGGKMVGEHFFQFVDFFPIPIVIFDLDGTLSFINRECCEAWGILNPKDVIGIFNVINDFVVNDELELRDFIKLAFKGEKVSISEIRVPLNYMRTIYKHNNIDFKIDSMYQDIICFPILNEFNNIDYIAAVFITKRIYKGRLEIAKAKEYMEDHWINKFELETVAKAVNLSTYHFSHLFKMYTGETPFSYYKKIKLQKLKEKLCDENIGIADAFAACGLDYSGYYAKIFKEMVGMSPSQYREMVLKNNKK